MVTLKPSLSAGDPFDRLALAIDEASWNWLSETDSKIAAGVSDAIDRDMEASDVRRFVMAQTMRLELALRCEQAARWLIHRREQVNQRGVR